MKSKQNQKKERLLLQVLVFMFMKLISGIQLNDRVAFDFYRGFTSAKPWNQFALRLPLILGPSPVPAILAAIFASESEKCGEGSKVLVKNGIFHVYIYILLPKMNVCIYIYTVKCVYVNNMFVYVCIYIYTFCIHTNIYIFCIYI